MSVLLIIVSAIDMIAGVLLIGYNGKVADIADKFGMSGRTLGAVGMILSLAGVFIIAIGAFMLFTGINGMRGRIEKCRKFTFWLLILQAGDLILAIVKHLGTTAPILWLLFFGVYYFLAKNYMKYDNTY